MNNKHTYIHTQEKYTKPNEIVRRVGECRIIHTYIE